MDDNFLLRMICSQKHQLKTIIIEKKERNGVNYPPYVERDIDCFLLQLHMD